MDHFYSGPFMEYSFVYDPDYLERIIEINNKNNFGKDVITSLKTLWESEAALDQDVILITHMW